LEIRCSRKQQRAVADARQAGTEPAIETLLGKFLADFLFDLFPFHAERRIGKHVVEKFSQQAVVGKRVAEDDIGDVLPLDEHVGFANGVGFRIQLLPIHDEPGARIQAGKMFAGHAQHSASAGGRIVERPHDARLGQGVVVLNEKEIHHEPDGVAWGEVFPGGFVGKLGEFADEFLEHRAHLALLTASGWRSMLANFSVTR
jgi:hypothetical protein